MNGAAGTAIALTSSHEALVGLRSGASRLLSSRLPVDNLQQVDIPGVGTLAYRSSPVGSGRALVFVHGAKVTSGPHELRALRAAFAARPTYALDWPGYGASSLPVHGVSAHHCARALVAFIEQVVPPEQQPVDLIALSRGCEFAARAALREAGYQAITVAERFEDWESTVETVPFSRNGSWAA